MKKIFLVVLVLLFALLAVAFVSQDTAQLSAETLYLFASDGPIGGGTMPPSFGG